MKLALRTTAWLILSAWAGGWLFFAVVVAPTAFRVLPSSRDAGQVVGPLLETLHLCGILAGLVLAGLSLVLGRGAWLVGIPLVLAGVCAYSEFSVTAAIDVVRPGAFGPAAEATAAAEFARLHGISRTLYGIVGAGLLTLIFLQTRSETRFETKT